MPKHDFHRTSGHVVQELAVMGNKQYGATESLQVIFEPLYGLYIQMVGGLVKEKHVRLAKKYLGKLHTHIPTLAEGLSIPLKFLFLKAKTLKHLQGACPGRLAGFQGKPVVDCIHPVYESRIFAGFIVLSLRKLGGKHFQLGLHLMDIVKDRENFLYHAHALMMLHDLGQIAYPDA